MINKLSKKIKLPKTKKQKIIVVSVFIGIAVIGFFAYRNLKGNGSSVQYVLAAVEKGTITLSVSGSGQIFASDEVTLQSKASGDLVYLGVKNGQFVKAGTLIAKVDTTDAQQAVKDAEINLESAKLNLEQAQTSSAIDETSLKRQAISYMTTALNNTKNVIDSFEDILFTDITSYNMNSKYLVDYYARIVNFYAHSDVNYDKVIRANFEIIKQENNVNQALFSNLDQNSTLEEIESVLNRIVETTKTLNDSVHLSYQLLNRYDSILNDNNLTPILNIRTVSSDKSTVSSFVTSVDSNTTNLLTIQKSIKTYRTSPSDVTPYAIRSLKLAVEQKENALENAKNQLKNYYVYAPFDGEISSVSVSKGDRVSSGTSLAVLITKQKIAKISLNEVDVVKVKEDQQAKLTFDAMDDLKIEGEVIEVDNVGTVSQGVVTYNVKIGFDTKDERVKSGMSVNAEIVTETKENILLVPNSAVKSLGEKYYVEMPGENNNSNSTGNVRTAKSNSEVNAPRQQPIKIGLANDSFTEILEGLKEGDKIIVKTLNSTNQQTKKTNSSASFSSPFSSPQRNAQGSGMMIPR